MLYSIDASFFAPFWEIATLSYCLVAVAMDALFLRRDRVRAVTDCLDFISLDLGDNFYGIISPET